MCVRKDEWYNTTVVENTSKLEIRVGHLASCWGNHISPLNAWIISDSGF